MKQEQKELLLKDLCSRLPYKVKVGTTDNDGSLENVWDTLWYNTFTEDVKLTHSTEDADKIVDISEVKPYLFPLSSMTEEQKQYLKNRFYYDWDGEPYDLWKCQIEIGEVDGLIDWFHENHIDYRSLIPMGLANDATGKNIY